MRRCAQLLLCASLAGPAWSAAPPTSRLGLRRAFVRMVSTAQADGAQPSTVVASATPPTSAPAEGLESSLPGQVISAMFEPGRRVVYGVFTEAVDAAAVPDDAERARRREAAAESLTNIDDAERERRRTVGQAGLWDVDGSGLQRIEDSQLAEAIKARVDGLNAQTLVTALGVTAAFVTIPSLLGADNK